MAHQEQLPGGLDRPGTPVLAEDGTMGRSRAFAGEPWAGHNLFLLPLWEWLLISGPATVPAASEQSQGLSSRTHQS